ncbi:MAG: GNAT family N-acetyltransferase [Thermoleophilia bacterium]|nr:GNAT family N-acetyltransferase [Thermoleophilia bacterium]
MELPSPALYRKADPADIGAVLPLLVEIMTHHGVAPPPEPALRDIVDQVLRSPDHSLLLAELDGEAVALCALLFSLSTWSAGPVCELQDVVVRHDHRGRGVGRGLLAAATEHARARGCKRLFLTAEAFNLPAHAFYRASGLQEKTVLYFEAPLDGGLPAAGRGEGRPSTAARPKP